MAEQVYFEDVRPGQTIPELSLVVDETRMFFFSATTYNGHRIHYDKAWARDVEGYRDVLVQGPLQAALLARTVTDWVGGRGTLVRYAIQNRASAFAGEKLTFRGTVTAVHEEGAGDSRRGLVDLELVGERDGETLMPGTATVSLPRRETPGARSEAV